MSNVVYKFGSKTLRSAEDVRKIVSFIPKINCIAIFSEFDGITPLICELANIANSNDHVNLEKKFNELKSFHTNIIKELHLSDKTLEKEFEELHDILISIKVNNDLDSRLLDSVLIYAEMFSTLIISKYARLPCINSLDIIITDDNYGHANIDEKLSNERFLKLNIPQTIIMAGNIGSDSITGNHTTLGLHGTDYTSAIIAKFFNSSEIVYWRPYAGLLSTSEPNVANPIVVPSINYETLGSLLSFGGDDRIMSQRAFEYSQQHNIRIIFKSATNPDLPGSYVNNDNSSRPFFLITSALNKNLITINNVSILDSHLYVRKIVKNDDTLVIVNDNDLKSVEVVLSIYKTEINRDVSVIAVITNSFNNEVLNNSASLLEKNKIKVYEKFLEKNNTVAWFIVEQQKNIDAIKILHEWVAKSFS